MPFTCQAPWKAMFHTVNGFHPWYQKAVCEGCRVIADFITCWICPESFVFHYTSHSIVCCNSDTDW